MSNGGLASGLAMTIGNIATVGLAPAIYGPLMNVTGSTIASYWRTKPIDPNEKHGDRKSKKAVEEKKDN
jgi:BASS family bile acid:Na+ symporter